MKKIYILSLIMAIIVGISVYLYANSLQEKMQNTVIPTGQVVVAITSIPANTMITSDMVAVVEMPEGGMNPLSAVKLSDVVGLITQYPLAPQEQILTFRLREQGKEGGGTLSYIVEEGQRAVSVGVDSVSGISGYIAKGDHVDVVATMIQKVNEESITISSMLVEDLLVLETGEKQIASAESTTATYTTVTISATPEQILKINYAVNNGKIILVLRSVLDHEEVKPDTFALNIPVDTALTETSDTDLTQTSDSSEIVPETTAASETATVGP